MKRRIAMLVACLGLWGALPAMAAADDTFTPAHNFDSGIDPTPEDDASRCYTDATLQSMRPGDVVQVGGSVTFNAPPAPGYDAIKLITFVPPSDDLFSVTVGTDVVANPTAAQTLPLTYALRMGPNVQTHQDYLAYLYTFDYNTVTGAMAQRSRGAEEFCATVKDPPATTYAATVQPPIRADGSSHFDRRGTIPVKFKLQANGAATCALPPATLRVSRGATMLKQAPFRITDCQYIDNLDARSLGSGTFRVEILIGGAVVGEGRFRIC
jgi:hypothetical protein